MRVPLAIALLAMAGCLSFQSAENPGPEASSTIASTPFFSPTPPLESPPPPRFADAGLHISSCAYRTTAMPYKHEWAEVPPEYRQANTLAGNIGQATLQVFDCVSANIGNQTFIPTVRVAFLAILVVPSSDLNGPEHDVFLLAAASDSQTLVAQLAETGMPAFVAQIELTEPGVRIRAEGFAATLDEALPRPQPSNNTLGQRLHWKAQEENCWADAVHVATPETSLEVIFHGEAGAAHTISGPAQTLTGLGERGTTSSQVTAPKCIGGQP